MLSLNQSNRRSNVSFQAIYRGQQTTMSLRWTALTIVRTLTNRDGDKKKNVFVTTLFFCNQVTWLSDTKLPFSGIVKDVMQGLYQTWKETPLRQPSNTFVKYTCWCLLKKFRHEFKLLLLKSKASWCVRSLESWRTDLGTPAKQIGILGGEVFVVCFN